MRQRKAGMADKPRILFVHKGLRSFIRKDLEILKKFYSVINLEYRSRKGLIHNLWEQFRLFLGSMLTVPNVNGVFIWFAGYHSFWPVFMARLFRKKVIIAIGGYETTYIPEIRYGVFSNPIRSFMARYSFKHAHYLLPVDEGLMQNLRKFVPDLTTPYQVFDFGYDANFWKRTLPKQNVVLTVGSINSEVVYKRKGIDIFVEACRQLPQYEFHVVGVDPDMVHRFPEIPNLKIFPPADPIKLREYYSRAKVYAQLSMYEGLPNVVCEAMLCECIPVVTPVNGMIRQAKTCGIVLTNRNTSAAVKAIKTAMAMQQSVGKQCREQAIKFFPLDKREKGLIAIVERVLKTNHWGEDE